MKSKIRVAHVGNLGNNAYNMCLFLQRSGIDAHLFLRPDEWQPDREEGAPVSADWIHRVETASVSARKGLLGQGRRILGGIDMLRRLMGYDLVHSWAGALVWIRGARPLMRAFQKPWVASATGADIREVAAGDSRLGAQLRSYFQHAAMVTCAPDPDHAAMIKRMNIKNYQFQRLPMDAGKYCPVQVPRLSDNSSLTFLVASNVDWAVTDPGMGRCHKGTDRFFRAFARWVHEGGRGKVVVLQKGPDVQVAKETMKKLGIEAHVEWRKEIIDRLELIKLYNQCDVVVDQFVAGSYGWVALEAMACAKPVITYIVDESHQLGYGETAPVLNARTEDDVFQQIKRTTNSSLREQIGRNARAFILRHHHWEVAIQDFIHIYEKVLAVKITPQETAPK